MEFNRFLQTEEVLVQQTRRAGARAAHRKDARHPTAWHVEQTAKRARMEITTDGC